MTWRLSSTLPTTRPTPASVFLLHRKAVFAWKPCVLLPRTNTGRSFQASPDPPGVLAQRSGWGLRQRCARMVEAYHSSLFLIGLLHEFRSNACKSRLSFHFAAGGAFGGGLCSDGAVSSVWHRRGRRSIQSAMVRPDAGLAFFRHTELGLCRGAPR